MKKCEAWERERRDWARALFEAANAIGKDSPLYQILGSVAYGRYEGEPCMSDSKDNAVFGAAYLQGVRDAAMAAGRQFDLKGTEHLERIHDRLREGG